MRTLASPAKPLLHSQMRISHSRTSSEKQSFVSFRPKALSLRRPNFSPHEDRKPNASTNLMSLLSLPNSGFYFADSSLKDDFEVELGRLLSLLPVEMRRNIAEHPESRNLIEIVMDLGRRPLARFPSGDFYLSEIPITFQDIEHATSQVGDFSTDNRAGISRTLHRISAIRNRKGVIIGLTCRVGRAISGSANLLRDLVKDGDSLLLIGPPGVGKTTIIREIARMLADDYEKRVMIVDTSNEIGGDGDIPHAGIGNARRMQVPHSDMQHKVLIEAVENHMPQVIVIDEIGTKLEAMAASTIAQRGIQLVATAHGVTIENLTMNPSLEMLVGGIQSVTLGDEEANRRGVQKTVLERKGPSTFTSAVEIISKSELRIHRSLETTVDALLSGRIPHFEVRKIQTQGIPELRTEVPENSGNIFLHKKDELMVEELKVSDGRIDYNESNPGIIGDVTESYSPDESMKHLYVYGVPVATVMQGIKQLGMGDSVCLTDNISEADGFLALHSKLRKNSGIQAVAKSRNIPIYVTKTSSITQITKAIRLLMNDHADGSKDLDASDKMNPSENMDALEEARLAIEQIVIPKGEPVELLPRSQHILSLQDELVQKYHLYSEKIGEEPDVRLRIYPFSHVCEGIMNDNELGKSGRFDDSNGFPADEINGFHDTVVRLPFLPD